MSDVIGFLETMGRDATLRHVAQNELELALIRAQIDPEIQTAILDKDQARIESLLGAATNICCGLFPEKQDEDESEEEPPKEDETTARSILCSTAIAA